MMSNIILVYIKHILG